MADAVIARRFNNRTKYVLIDDAEGVDQIRMGIPPDLGPALGQQDPTIEPAPFKNYLDLDPIRLPAEPLTTDLSALDAIMATGELPGVAAIPDLTTLARILQRSNGILKRWTTPWGKEFAFRAAGQTGARYHLEIYAICGELDGLPAGIYHYGPQDHALRQLRSGDYRPTVSSFAGDDSAIATAPAILAISSEFWRNAWRYQARSYRHVYWDLGTMLSNTLAMAASAGLPAQVVLGFHDAAINHLLGIDGRREAALGLVALGRAEQEAPHSRLHIVDLNYQVVPVSQREIAFPDLEEIQRASSLESTDAVRRWRVDSGGTVSQPPTGPAVSLAPRAAPAESIEDVIERRRSNRHYQPEQALSFADFSTVLSRAVAGASLDVAASPTDVYLIVNNVEGLEPGAYYFDRRQHEVELLEDGDFRAEAERLACGQSYAADAQVNVYAMTDLDAVFARYGNRGYRLAQFDAALIGGRLQLAAHALGLGAVGSTCPDDEVTAFFSPHAANKSFVFIAVFGIPRKPTAAENAAASRFLNRDRA